MKNTGKFRLYLMIVSSFLLVICTTYYGELAYASSFSVKPQKSAHQISNNSYFDLLLSPKETETLVITISNTNDFPIETVVSIDSARTTSELVVDYGNKLQNDKVDSSLEHNLKNILSLKETTYKIAKNSSIQVPITVNMPVTSFDGVLAGGIIISERLSKSDGNEDEKLTLDNLISYEIGVLIRNTKGIKASEQINFKKFKVNKNSLNLEIQNPVSNFINKVEMDIQIDGNNNFSYSKQIKDLQMAPNSSTIYEIPFPKGMTVGSYTLKLKMKDYKNNVWTFEKEMTLSSEHFSQKKIKEKKTVPFYWIIIVILVIIIVFLLQKNSSIKKKNNL